jgi:hypothetical protein
MKKIFLLFITSGLLLSCASKTITLTVQTGDYERIDCVVSADVSKLNLKELSDITLYELTKPIVDVEDTQETLILKNAGKPVLQYYYAHLDPPGGVDAAYGRSGFIHPAWSPAGNVLTNIQPTDHRHHLGFYHTKEK